MKSLLILWGFTAVLGVFTWQYSNHVLSSIKFEYTAPVLQDMSYSEGQTKIFPDVQLQQASAVQGTIGVE